MAIAEQLLAAGACVNLADVTGDTPLHCAVSHGRVEVAKTLITRGANVLPPLPSLLPRSPLLTFAHWATGGSSSLHHDTHIHIHLPTAPLLAVFFNNAASQLTCLSQGQRPGDRWRHAAQHRDDVTLHYLSLRAKVRSTACLP